LSFFLLAKAIALSVLILGVSCRSAFAFADGQAASLTIGSINPAFHLSFDSSGNLWVGTQDKLLEYSPPFTSSTPSFALVGSATQGTSFNGSGTNAEFDSAGDMWVSTSQARILEFKPPFSSGMNASLVIGQPNFRSTGFSSSPTQYNVYPVVMEFDSSGNLWALDGMHDRVLEYRLPFSSSMPASVVLGQPNFFTDDRALSQYGGLFFAVESYGDISFDQSGDLWVSSGIQNRVLEFKPPFRNGMNASLVIGQPDFTSISQSASSNGLSGPLGVAFDHTGNLWVGDATMNRRILRFTPPFTSGMSASLALGQGTLGCCQLGGWIAFDPSGNLWESDPANSRVVEFLSSVAAVTSTTSTSTSTTLTSTSTTTTAVPEFGAQTLVVAILVTLSLVAVFGRSSRARDSARSTRSGIRHRRYTFE
jgi:hypothetical protein